MEPRDNVNFLNRWQQELEGTSLYLESFFTTKKGKYRRADLLEVMNSLHVQPSAYSRAGELSEFLAVYLQIETVLKDFYPFVKDVPMELALKRFFSGGLRDEARQVLGSAKTACDLYFYASKRIKGKEPEQRLPFNELIFDLLEQLYAEQLVPIEEPGPKRSKRIEVIDSFNRSKSSGRNYRYITDPPYALKCLGQTVSQRFANLSCWFACLLCLDWSVKTFLKRKLLFSPPEEGELPPVLLSDLEEEPWPIVSGGLEGVLMLY